MNQTNDEPHGDTSGNWLFSRGTIVACIALTTVGILLLTGHQAHLLGFAPYLLLLACPLMHLFMHGGHGGHHEPRGSAREAHREPDATETGSREQF